VAVEELLQNRRTRQDGFRRWCGNARPDPAGGPR
jgi:hypothetical protein